MSIPNPTPREALVRAAAQFTTYAEHHMRKGTAESLDKAKVNIEMAAVCARAVEAIDAANLKELAKGFLRSHLRGSDGYVMTEADAEGFAQYLTDVASGQLAVVVASRS